SLATVCAPRRLSKRPVDAFSSDVPPGPGWELFTDLYELTMLQAYFNEGMEGEATFELYVRTLPLERNFLIAAGLDQALSYLETLSFSPTSIEYLQSLGSFSAPFLDHLSKLRFTGNVRAVR